MKIESRLPSIIWTGVFIAIVMIWLMPIVFALGTSFRSLQDVYDNVLAIFPTAPTFENYNQLFEQLPMFKIIMNNFTIATTVTILKLVTSFLAAYALVFFRFTGKKPLYFLFIATIFIPFTVTMVPNYIMLSKVGLTDHIAGVILPQVADAVGIFLLTQVMRSIPYSLIESAKLDEIGHFRIMKDIVLPLISPQITSVGIWFFVNSWNEFVWPSLILKSKESYTLPLALQMFISSEGGTNFAVAMAVSVITMSIPLLLYLIFQKYIIGTFTASGIK
ncbi:carbohydrate ABC transporter permease [Siminovitchia sp. FSL H7-0308]|uniref:Sn-glycerol 3-phosphate transport system permease protein n=1 Tax=Siminovitchia thermophila TaxID=1245522 RepID=A0ABS2R7P4_9BACI|nr:carbohydrate ABC transporter permease [Siminovitchia thermophila]MBM7715174.1 sn-glycerol 3-phosphate transport system permease protein [Siminovitchia thermophila]ONK22755.1 ABC transporter permease [Bacillus sp. VT-16-64]